VVRLAQHGTRARRLQPDADPVLLEWRVEARAPERIEGDTDAVDGAFELEPRDPEALLAFEVGVERAGQGLEPCERARLGLDERAEPVLGITLG
jgi:hypothetical protein